MATRRGQVLDVEMQGRRVFGELGEVTAARVHLVAQEIDHRDRREDPAATAGTGRDGGRVEVVGEGEEPGGLVDVEHELLPVFVEDRQHVVGGRHRQDGTARARRHRRPYAARFVHAVTVVEGTLAWGDHADPVPGSQELLVAVRAAGLNGADMLQRRGLYAAPPGSPADIPGLELAGEVLATGPGCTRFAAGDRVMAVVGGGGQAELAVVHERAALPVPDRLSWPEAGGFPEVFTTAHDALFTQCGVTIGERVLVHGAAGGVGLAGVQLAAGAGAHVVATVRDEARRADVARIGQSCGSVDVVAPDGFVEHGPYDVVLEVVGASNLPDDL